MTDAGGVVRPQDPGARPAAAAAPPARGRAGSSGAPALGPLAARVPIALALAAVAEVMVRSSLPGLRRGLSPAGRPDDLVGAGCGIGAAATAAWLSAALMLVVGSAAPGVAGAAARCLVTAVTPRVLRRVLCAGLGTGLTLGLASPAALAGPAPRPSTGALPATVVLDRPVGPAPTRVVVVRRGDSLWSIAARSLDGQPSAREVAASWPLWWAANRAVIGSDPALIHPGQRLRPPRAAHPTTEEAP